MTAPFNMASVGPILKIFLEQQQASPKPERITAKTKIEMDPISRAIAQLRKVGYTDQQLMMVRTNAQHQTQAINDLRKAGWTDDDLMGLGRAMSGAWEMQYPPPQGIRQAPPQQRPVPEMRSAQPGQTRVTPQMVQQQQMGQVRQWAAQQANDPRAVGGMVADMLPVIGDIKAGFDAVSLFQSGHPLAGALALASMLPGIPGAAKSSGNIKLYHGSPRSFKSFDASKIESSALGERGFFFYDKPTDATAYGPNVIEIEVPMEKIANLSDPSLSDIPVGGNVDAILKSRGYEGFHNPLTREFVVYEPNKFMPKERTPSQLKVMRDGREVPYGVTTVPTIKRAIEKVGADTFKREVEFTGLIRDWNMDNPLEAAIAVEETARRIDLGALGREKPWLWQHNAPEIIKERAKRFSMGEK